MLMLGLAALLAYVRLGYEPTPVSRTEASINFVRAEGPVDVTASEGDAGKTVDRAVDGMFYMNAVVNGQSIRFLIDTGASVVVLTPEDARLAGVEGRTSASDKIQTAGGDSSASWATLDHVAVGGRKLRNVRAAVMKNGLGVSLLGQNALSEMGVITIDRNQLHIQ
jgi:aspartyl protease family protein